MTTGPQPGGLLERFLARLIDGILLAIVLGIIDAVILGAIFTGGGNFIGTGGSIGFDIVSAVLTAIIYLGYFAYLESSRGQTLGKMALKLHVQGPSGAKPTMEEAVKRNIWVAFGILGVIPIIGGLIGAVAELVAVIMIAVGINGDPVRRQSWADKFAGGTQVIKQG